MRGTGRRQLSSPGASKAGRSQQVPTGAAARSSHLPAGRAGRLRQGGDPPAALPRARRRRNPAPTDLRPAGRSRTEGRDAESRVCAPPMRRCARAGRGGAC